MKTFITSLLALLLLGCASPDAGKPWVRLYDEQYLRDQQKWPMTLAQVQQALFAHEVKCGVAASFEVEPVQPNIAHVWFNPSPESGPRTMVLLELARLYGESLRVQAYANLGVQDDEIRRVYNMILTPDVCS